MNHFIAVTLSELLLDDLFKHASLARFPYLKVMSLIENKRAGGQVLSILVLLLLDYLYIGSFPGLHRVTCHRKPPGPWA